MKTLSKQDAIILGAKLREIFYDFPDVNAGGCGLAAVEIFYKFKRLGYSPRIVAMCSIFDRSSRGFIEQNVDKINHMFRTGELKNETPDHWVGHYMVLVDGFYFDCSGMCEGDGSNLITTGMGSPCWEHLKEIEIGALKILNTYKSCWNPCFQRSDMDEISRMINTAFEHLRHTPVVNLFTQFKSLRQPKLSYVKNLTPRFAKLKIA